MTVLPKDGNFVPIQILSYKKTDGTIVHLDETSPLITGEFTPSGALEFTSIAGVSPAQKEFTRPADTTAYTAKDCVSNSTSATTLMDFTVAANNGEAGYITKARLVTDNSAVTARFRLYLYTVSNPTVVADNVSFALLYANKANRIGHIDFPAMGTEGGSSDSASTLATPGDAQKLPLYFKTVSDTKIYGVLVTLDAFTPTSGQKFWVELSVDLA